MKDLLNKLKENNILLEAVDGELKIFAADPVINPDLLAGIKENKDELLRFLLSNDQAAFNKSFGRKIPAITGQPHYPLSPAQRRLWILSRFEGGNTAYNMSGAHIFEGKLDRSAFEYALFTLVDRHESLRTIFKKDEGGDIRQFILPSAENGFNITYVDLQTDKDRDEKVRQLLAEGSGRPFDLAAGPLLRVWLYQMEARKWIFSYTMHHIISDAWSMNILVKELLSLYNTHILGEPNRLRPLPIQYKDYTSWLQTQLSGYALQTHEGYWLQQLDGELPVLDLPVDKTRRSVKTYNGGVIHKIINNNLADGIKLIGQEQGATLFMGLLAAVNVLLYRYTNQDDIIIGSPIAARGHSNLEDQIGFYVNTLPLRARFRGADSYKELVRNIKGLTLSAYEHQLYPLDELIEKLSPRANAGRNPLFDVLIELRAGDPGRNGRPERLGDITVSAYEYRLHTISKFDLTFFFTQSNAGLELMIEYNSDLFYRETIERLSAHLENLMGAIVNDPDISIDRLDYIGLDERHRLLVEFNDTKVDYPGDRTIIDLIEEQVAEKPGEVALSHPGTELTYRELNEKANQVAHYLKRNFGIRKGDLVGIMLDRSENMIIAILGVLKSGGAYVPIDPDHPAHRKSFIIRDTGIKGLITQLDHTYDLEYQGDAIFVIDVQLDGIDMPTGSPGKISGPDGLAYVIYTSGSTGVPKGCAITHRNVFNYIQWANEYYFGEGAEPVFGLFTPLTFDLTVTSIFCCLTRGGRLFIYPQQENIQEILTHSFQGRNGINSIKLTPSHINMLEHIHIGHSGIERAIVGGEEVTSRHVNILKRINPSMKVYNEYGPTEATVGCVVAELHADTPVLIGRPVANTDIYISDERGQLCPVGIPGEIGIGGEGVAREYLNNPALTDEKFMANPFKEGYRMYRTGDWGRWLPDGNLEFLGRKDGQVKINGHRMELGEIESALLAHKAIRDGVVLAKKNTEGDNELFAYYVPVSPGAGQEDVHSLITAIEEWLRQHLPSFMIPYHFIQLDEIPLTRNGKVDREALSNMEDPGGKDGELFIAPRNDIEGRMAVIWQEVLGLERIGIKDNFFSLGGNSIKAMRLIARINKEFDVDYSLDRLFGNQTIEEVAIEIEKTDWINRDMMEIDNTQNAEKFSI